MEPDASIPLQQPNQDLVLQGDLVIKGLDDEAVFRVDRESGSMTVRDPAGGIVFELRMPGTSLRIGGPGFEGDLIVWPGETTDPEDLNQSTFFVNGNEGSLVVGSRSIRGRLVLRGGDLGEETLALDGTTGRARLGGHPGADGKIDLRSGDGQLRISLDATNGEATVRSVRFSDDTVQTTAAEKSPITSVTAGEGLSASTQRGEVELRINQTFFQNLSNGILDDVSERIEPLNERIDSLERQINALLLQGQIPQPPFS